MRRQGDDGATGRRDRSLRGQSLVEFALILPLLLVLLLGVADFGRVFADGITVEAAARDAAEAAAQEYLQLCAKTASTDPTCDLGLAAADYQDLHDRAVEVACREGERLTNVIGAGGSCTNPVIAVCVHDNSQHDIYCGQEAQIAGVPTECTAMTDPSSWSPVRAGPADGRPYVEVRMCYRFESLIPLTQSWWGTAWLQRENQFVVANY